MVKKYLITTRDKSTWPKGECKKLFLGSWCIPFEKKVDYEVLPYHWDNRNKLFEDYKYIQNFSFKVLKSLAKTLNQIHKIDYDIKKWDLIIGFWVSYFIQVIYDRWECISNIEKKSFYSICHKENLEELIPLDSKKFVSDTSNSDRFNSFIYSLIMEHKGNFNLTFLKARNKINHPKKVRSKKRFLIKTYDFFYSKFTKPNSPFIYNPYLSIINQIYLSFHFRCLPALSYNEKKINSNPDLTQRNWRLDLDTNSDFEKFIIKIIPKLIPVTYLEGFKKVLNQISISNLPKSPRFIFTANSFYFDDFFKIYAAKSKLKNSKLLTMQHGGNYGTTKFNYYQDYQTSISDIFFSWGWSNDKKVKPLGYLNKSNSIFFPYSKKREVLLVTTTLPRYSYTLYSIPIASQWLNYFENQIQFTNHLNKVVRKNLTIRLSHEDYMWESKKRWEKFYSDLKIDNGLIPMRKLIVKTKIYVSTYNATTFLESLYMDIPTIIFWDKKYWEMNDFTFNLFEKLKAVKVFHESPVSAANHVNNIFNNPEIWWRSFEVKSAVKEVKRHFCKKTKIKELVNGIRNHI